MLKLLFHERLHIAPKVFPLAAVADFRQIYTSQSVHFESGISHLSVSHSLRLFYPALYKFKLILISDKISSILNQVRTGLSTFFRSTHKKHTQDAAQRVYLSSSLFFESSLPLSSLLHQRLLVGPSYCKCGYRFVPLVCSLCSAIETAHIIFTRITTHAHPCAEVQIVSSFSGGTETTPIR